MTDAAAIARFTVSADWEAERPLSDAALATYARQGCLLLRGFAAPDLIARFRDEVATMLGLVLRERGLDPAGSALARFDRGLISSCRRTVSVWAASTRRCASCRACTA